MRDTEYFKLEITNRDEQQSKLARKQDRGVVFNRISTPPLDECLICICWYTINKFVPLLCVMVHIPLHAQEFGLPWTKISISSYLLPIISDFV